MRRIYAEGLDEPVVQRPVHIELEGTDGVGDSLYGITLSVGIVVHRVDAPFVSGAVVMRMLDTVQKRIAEHHVGMGHVNLGTEDFLSISVFAVTHLPKELQVLFYAAVSPRAVCARLVHCSSVL